MTGTHKYSRIFRFLKLMSIMTMSMVLFLASYIPLKNIFVKLGIIDVVQRDIYTAVIIFFMATISLLLHVLVLNKIYDTLSTYYYITDLLDTPISYSDAKYLKRIFEPAYLKSDTWMTMQNIVTLPEGMRKKAIFDAAKKILGEEDKNQRGSR